jgi:hypothetical protein
LNVIPGLIRELLILETFWIPISSVVIHYYFVQKSIPQTVKTFAVIPGLTRELLILQKLLDTNQQQNTTNVIPGLTRELLILESFWIPITCEVFHFRIIFFY